MQYLPLCVYDGHFWPKKKCLFYVAVGTGSSFNRYRLRFCPTHAATIDEDLAQYELLTDGSAISTLKAAASHCFSCGNPLDEAGTQCFITGYPSQDERKDYWFQIHTTCTLPVVLQDYYLNA